jgi:hypothetical protein
MLGRDWQSVNKNAKIWYGEVQSQEIRRGKKQYRAEISDRFGVLEDIDDDVDINIAWETVREYINISTQGSLGYYELEKHTPWF